MHISLDVIPFYFGKKRKKKKYLLTDGSIFYSNVLTTPAVLQAFSHYSPGLQRSLELMAKKKLQMKSCCPYCPDHTLCYRLSSRLPCQLFLQAFHILVPSWLELQK